jgi:hypothetical protein
MFWMQWVHLQYGAAIVDKTNVYIMHETSAAHPMLQSLECPQLAWQAQADAYAWAADHSERAIFADTGAHECRWIWCQTRGHRCNRKLLEVAAPSLLVMMIHRAPGHPYR